MNKPSVLVFLGLCALLGQCLQGVTSSPVQGPDELSMEELRGIMANVPEKERNRFIRNKVDLGYRIKELKEQYSNNDDGELAVQIFDYFVDNQQAIEQRKAVINSLSETICFPDPVGCIDTDDPGIHP